MASMKAKKKCCRDRPRCKACPVVLKRLSDAGLLEREGKRRYSFDAKPPKAAVAQARAA
ncbi:hypothetical protein [Jiangella alkaliphila]|uniref:Uncharacterized protein n=1 Tax=Jiangella alkaliphila TaxID=419479 RepID=A0A1H2L2P3_9ACTN|nr:hypothetical protein [Jiangella alkaliphila]SDU75052.1 hypothetical protein SAMN04488563_4876 [Jiangella alkaliphila]